LLSDFPTLLRAARQLESSNEGDDDFVKIAFVGFQRAAPASRWTGSHQQVIRDLRNGDYADDELSWYEDDATAVAQFACLFYGYMLGLNEAGVLHERERAAGEALLPGLIASDLEQVAAAASMVAGRDA
jgi:hypothetical protein